MEKNAKMVRPSRNIKGGIVGLANVGKTSVFNMLTEATAPVDINVFTTIDPNFMNCVFPDRRLDVIAESFQSATKSPSYVSLLDTCGLVRDAHLDEGIGNDFLSQHQPMDILVHVVRAFLDDNITHVEESVDPVRDIEIVNDELIAKDIELVNFGLSKLEYIVARGSAGREPQYEYDTLCKAYRVLSGSEYVPKKVKPTYGRSSSGSVSSGSKSLKSRVSSVEEEDEEETQPGRPIRLAEWDKNELAVLIPYQLLTAKEMIYILNLSMRDFLRTEHAFSTIPGLGETVARYGGGRVIPLSVQFEEHFAAQRALGSEEFEIYQLANPTHLSAVGPIFSTMYRQMDLICFYTASATEAKVWYIPQGTNAPDAGEKIDTNIGRDFICADVMTFDDLKELGSEEKVKRVGRMLQQGKKYVVNDGDIMAFQSHKKY